LTGAAPKGLLHSDPSSAGIMGILELFVKLGQRVDLHRGCACGGKQGLVLTVDSSGHFSEGVTGMAVEGNGVGSGTASDNRRAAMTRNVQDIVSDTCGQLAQLLFHPLAASLPCSVQLDQEGAKYAIVEHDLVSTETNTQLHDLCRGKQLLLEFRPKGLANLVLAYGTIRRKTYYIRRAPSRPLWPGRTRCRA